MSLAPGFSAALLDECRAAGAGPELHDNVDAVRFPRPLEPLDPTPGQAVETLATLLAAADGFERLWRRLDPEGRALMVKLLAYRVLGHRRVELPLGPGSRMRDLAAVARARLVVEEDIGPSGLPALALSRFDLAPLGLPIRLESHLLQVLCTFVLEQYRCEGPPVVTVEPGDVVIDGGACWGDTSLLFAHLAGPAGRVLACEFEPANLATLERNLAANPELAARVEVVPHPLWSAPGEHLAFSALGPGTFLGAGERTVETQSVDAVVRARGLAHVDFVKLDVEGSEGAVLEGARETLCAFRPKLAVCAYHRLDDLSALPAAIDALGLGYRIAIEHFTMHAEETILFAWCDG